MNFLSALKPTLAQVTSLAKASPEKNLIPVWRELSADLETPVSAFLKITNGAEQAFLFESVEGGEHLARYSFIGCDPFKVLRMGPGQPLQGDPLRHLEREMAQYRLLEVPELQALSASLPSFTGGAVGYVGYDAVRYFEPRTEKHVGKQKPVMDIPESMFMLCDALVVFDHVRHTITALALCRLDTPDLAKAYAAATAKVVAIARRLVAPLPVDQPSSPAPTSSPSPSSTLATATTVSGSSSTASAGVGEPSMESMSNVGRAGYEAFVRELKRNIVEGEIIQAVPSQRIKTQLPSTVSAFDLYRQYRMINPSPYMFFVRCGHDTEIVGASPEMLCKVEHGKVTTHPIAGTRRRGKTRAEDDALAKELLADPKERAEHIMLVDLGRNDVGRVSKPGSVVVEELMQIYRYSHVMHIVSVVSGKMRTDKSPYDAFRAIFPAGTVSGAPKVRAMELVASLEKERRHVYAGAVGYVGFSGVLDTAIAIRTIVVHRGVAYLQAGGGIVYDSKESDEYEETVNKIAGAWRAVQTVVERKQAASKSSPRWGQAPKKRLRTA